MPFEEVTLQQLRSNTLGQNRAIVTSYVAKLKNKDVCDFIWTIRGITIPEISLETITEKQDLPQGQSIRVYQKTDILKNKMGSRKTEWTYYPTGEVDTITTTQLDENDHVTSTKTIKHFTDGRQPIIL